jgi:hypothetical protein
MKVEKAYAIKYKCSYTRFNYLVSKDKESKIEIIITIRCPYIDTLDRDEKDFKTNSCHCKGRCKYKVLKS